MGVDTPMIKQGWANGKVIFFSRSILPLRSTDEGLPLTKIVQCEIHCLLSRQALNESPSA
jgi:hypothetical protein